MIVGFFVICIYGFAVGLAIIVAIFLQTPEEVGGYGFTPRQNALCEWIFEFIGAGKTTDFKTFSQFYSVGWSRSLSTLRYNAERQSPTMDLSP